MRLYVRMQSNNTIKGRRGLRCGEALTPTRPRRLDVHRTPKRKARGRFYIVFKHISDKEILTESPWPPCWMWRQLQWTVLAHALGFSMRACQQQRGCLGPWAKIIQVLSPLSLSLSLRPDRCCDGRNDCSWGAAACSCLRWWEDTPAACSP